MPSFITHYLECHSIIGYATTMHRSPVLKNEGAESKYIFVTLKPKESLKEGYHDSADVSKSKYLCSLLINVIAFKPHSDVIQESHAIVSRGRITDDQT